MKTNKEIEAMLFLNAFKKANREFEADPNLVGHLWVIIATIVILFLYLFIPFTI